MPCKCFCWSKNREVEQWTATSNSSKSCKITNAVDPRFEALTKSDKYLKFHLLRFLTSYKFAAEHHQMPKNPKTKETAHIFFLKSLVTVSSHQLGANHHHHSLWINRKDLHLKPNPTKYPEFCVTASDFPVKKKQLVMLPPRLWNSASPAGHCLQGATLKAASSNDQDYAKNRKPSPRAFSPQ